MNVINIKELKKFNKKIIELDELDKIIKNNTYLELHSKISELVKSEVIEGVKSSGSNGKNPVLFKKYRIIYEKEDKTEILREINYTLSTKFSVTYYKNHLKEYEEHRKWIIMINDFFINRVELLKKSVSMNERAFQIWGREKFLQKEGGKRIVKNLGLHLEDLNYYDTSEPLAYYSRTKMTPQNILIIENKDTYYTFRRHLIAGNKTILGKEIHTLIYGGGKNISKAFTDYDISVETHVSHRENQVFYFGDLDFEGIIIYEKLHEAFSKDYKLMPFISGYIKMLDKAKISNIILPNTKEKQNRNIKDIFLKEFKSTRREQILFVLEKDEYIPQEIITIHDLGIGD